MVYHDHDWIKALRCWKISDEVHSDEGEKVGVFWLDRLQSQVWWVTVDLVLLSNSTSFHIIPNKGGHAWPPVVLLYNLLSSQLSWVSPGVLNCGIVAVSYIITPGRWERNIIPCRIWVLPWKSNPKSLISSVRVLHFVMLISHLSLVCLPVIRSLSSTSIALIKRLLCNNVLFSLSMSSSGQRSSCWESVSDCIIWVPGICISLSSYSKINRLHLACCQFNFWVLNEY